MKYATTSRRWGLLIAVWISFFLAAPAFAVSRPKRSSRHAATGSTWGRRSHRIGRIEIQSQWGVVESLRAGATDMEEEVDIEIDEAVDLDDEDSDDDEEDYDEESSSDEEEEEIDVSIEEYDKQLTPPPGLQMGGLLGVMLLSRRLDLFNPKVVRFARFIFILYIIAQQAFLVYVRIQAKLTNDRTEIETINPLSGLVSSQLSQKQDMVKDLASQFLSSKTTIMEYDLKQAKNMNSGLLVNMAFMWFLHFKMEQTQPLLAQTVTGVLNLVYSPLFQVYMLGRNLERPFKNPASKGLAALNKQAEAAKQAAEAEEEDVEIDVEVDEIEVESSSDDDYDESDDDESDDDNDETNDGDDGSDGDSDDE